MERGLFRRIEFLAKGNAMEQRNVVIALFVMIGIMIFSNFYVMYELNWAIKMISLCVENLPK